MTKKKPANHRPPELFSETLSRWLHKRSGRTLQNLSELFAEKSFAILFLLLMALPALPVPTGGITHLTELITLLLCLELIVGRKTVWLPQKWLHKNVGRLLSGKAAARLISIVQWFERHSRRRGSWLLVRGPFLSFVGLVVWILTVAAFLSPPFSGLDTLPSLGVVTISLGLILEDLLIVVTGMMIGAAGVGISIAAGSAIYSGFHHLF